MASKSRGGLSKREFAAQAKAKAAPKVSSTKISTATKQSQPSYNSSGMSIAPKMSAGDAFQQKVFGQVYNENTNPQEVFNQSQLGQAFTKANGGVSQPLKGATFDSSNYSKPKSSSKKTKSSPSKVSSDFSAPTSNRSLAQSAFNKTLGISTANASTGPKPVNNATSSNWRDVLDKGIGIAKDAGNILTLGGIGRIDKGIHSLGFDLTDTLGIPKSQALQINLDPTQSEQFSAGIMNPQNSVTDSTIGEESSTQRRASEIQNMLNSGGQAFADQYYKSTGNNNPNKTPRPVTNPTPVFTPSTDISSINQQEIRPQYPQFDFTPEQPQNAGTQRQFLGNGYLSNGIANNGKGNYGIQGAMTGTGQNEVQSSPMDDLLTLLAIKPMTAQAAETTSFAPQSFSQPQANPFNIKPANDYANSDTYKNVMAGLYGSQDNAPVAKTQQTSQGVGGSGQGGVAQQYAQPTTNALSLMQQQNKGFSAQEKAQKRATEELIKSIKKQYQSQIDATNKTYDTQQSQGQSELEKAKQADLLKLSGLFNFSANQSPDSEQRIQYEQRAQDEANNTLKDFLAKIVAARGTDITNLQSGQNKDISSAKQNLQTALASIAEKRGNSQLEIAKMQDSLNAAKIKAGASSMGLNSNAVGSLQSYLSARRGQDGFVSPQDYAQAQQAFVQDYPTKASSFSALFPVHQYLSPAEYKNIYGSSQPPINISFDNQQ